jgi:hypothetical protein
MEIGEVFAGATRLRRRLVAALRRLDESHGVSLGWQAVIFVLALLATFTRRPDAFLHSQFYAEDTIWYGQAYNLHWLRSLVLPQAGYLQTFPRLVAGATLLFPLLWAPLIMNTVGAIVQVLPVTALLSRRCSTWGPLHLRIVMSIIYVAIPNAAEVHIVLTNAMWHLALLQLLMAFAEPPRNWQERASDLVLFSVGAISGPFCILMLLPVAIYWWLRRQPWTLVVASILFLGATAQAFFIHSYSRAPGMPLGAGFIEFLRLLAGSVFVDSMLGRGGPRLPVSLLLIAAAGGLTILVWGLWKAPLPFRLFALFAVITFAASLKDPLVFGPLPRWQLLAMVVWCRYWYYPSLLFLWSAAWCVTQGRGKLSQLAGSFVLLLMLAGAVRQWVYPPWPDHHYLNYVERFRGASPGQEVIIPVYPDGWNVDLIKQ